MAWRWFRSRSPSRCSGASKAQPRRRRSRPFGAGVTASVGTGRAAGAVGGGVFAGGVALNAAAVVTAAGVAGGVGVVGAAEVESKKVKKTPAARSRSPASGSVRPLLSGECVRAGCRPRKGERAGQTKAETRRVERGDPPRAERGKSAEAKVEAPGQSDRQAKPTKKIAGQGRKEKRATPAANRLRRSLEPDKVRRNAVEPRKSSSSRNGKR